MTPQEIKDRLAEIAEQEQAHAARDLDAELAAVMAEGGDLDAIEDAHLQAERQARRYRVERQALEAALPEAERKQARAVLDQLAASHAELLAGAPAIRDEVVRKAKHLQKALTDWQEIENTADAITRQAEITAKAADLRDSRFGLIAGPEVIEALDSIKRINVTGNTAYFTHFSHVGWCAHMAQR